MKKGFKIEQQLREVIAKSPVLQEILKDIIKADGNLQLVGT